MKILTTYYGVQIKVDDADYAALDTDNWLLSPGGNVWRARIKFQGQEMHIGVYRDYTEAVKARLKREKELFGEFSPHKVT